MEEKKPNEVAVIDKEKSEKQIREFRPNAAFSTNLVPKGFKEAMEMATVLAKSNVVPKEMIGRPESCFVAIGFGMELGLPPLQAVQNIMVVNGRPSIWGDAALALVEASGQVRSIQEDAPHVALKQGFGRCIITKLNGDVVERQFSKDDAIRAKLWTKEGPWQTYPGRMLQMRARSWALRDAAPQVLKGIQFREEMADIEVIHAPIEMPKRLERPKTVQDASLVTGGGDDLKETANPPQIEPQAAESIPEPGDAQEPVDGSEDLKITEVRRKELFKMWTDAKIKLEDVKKFVRESFGLENTAELTNNQARILEIWIKAPAK